MLPQSRKKPLSKRPLYAASALIAALATTFMVQAAPPQCPQPRFTGKAPDDYYTRTNPLSAANTNVRIAEPLFLGETGKVNCAICHGVKGDGKGVLADQYDPPPRNFSCAMTINGVPDGQLFWIIRFGSPGSAMPPHPALKDEQVWQLVLYLRQLSK